MRGLAVAATLVICIGCGGSSSSPTSATAPTTPAPAAANGAVTSQAKTPSDGFQMHVVCEPKAKGAKHNYFEVAPASGGPGTQVRCGGYVDLKAAGSFVVAPMSDTNQAFNCTPYPATVTAKKNTIKVTCSLG